MLECQPVGQEGSISTTADRYQDFCFNCAGNKLCYISSTLTISECVGDQVARERTGDPPMYAEAKKMKSSTLRTHGAAQARLRN